MTPKSVLADVETATTALRQFRTDLHSTFTRWPDALFELCDATITAPGSVSSVPTLSLASVFRRSHGTLYKCLARGAIDTAIFNSLLAANRPADWPDVFAVDASNWPKCNAETSPERGYYYDASRHSSGQPIIAGYQYQLVTQLSWRNDSWTAPVDMRRISPLHDAFLQTVDQVRGVAERVTQPGRPAPTFVFDAGYDPIALTDHLADTDIEIVVRTQSDRVFYTQPTMAPNSRRGRGRPKLHDNPMKCSNPDTWAPPDMTTTMQDSRYGTITINAWNNRHPKLFCRGRWENHTTPPIIEGTVIHVEVEHLPKPSMRATNDLWLWRSGPGTVNLEHCALAYLRRFDIEHTFRFLKNTLGWTKPALMTPEQSDLWTALIIAAYTQLRLARPLIADQRLPWERPRQPHQLSPARIRRQFHQLGPTIGTPANPPKTVTPGPGRPKGTPKPPRTRHPAIKRTKTKAA